MRTKLPKPKLNLHLSDCLRGLQDLKARSVDVVITSPPYNIGTRYGTYRDTLPTQEYLDWCSKWGREVHRVLKPDGSFFLTLGGTSRNPVLPFEVALRMAQLFKLQNTIYWIKSISIEHDSETRSYGHFKPINSRRFLNECHEYVFHFTPKGTTALDRLAVGVPYADKANVKRWSHTQGNDNRCRGNVWFIPYRTIQQRDKDRPHPATFPTELAVKCIRLHGRPGCTVLDPFLGIGHSALAAKECNGLVSRFIGFEIDKQYIKRAAKALDCSYSTL